MPRTAPVSTARVSSVLNPAAALFVSGTAYHPNQPAAVQHEGLTYEELPNDFRLKAQIALCIARSQLPMILQKAGRSGIIYQPLAPFPRHELSSTQPFSPEGLAKLNGSNKPKSPLSSTVISIEEDEAYNDQVIQEDASEQGSGEGGSEAIISPPVELAELPSAHVDFAGLDMGMDEWLLSQCGGLTEMEWDAYDSGEATVASISNKRGGDDENGNEDEDENDEDEDEDEDAEGESDDEEYLQHIAKRPRL